ncbi:mycofactocin-coupled SDR family oxidoreductase [Mycobacterium montefiorense]|uniref:Short-chain dehydrogenase/reductase n=1 Tax=Mycobacterium montefiorense TaxID=154654 RepID=A0AA37PWA2_9MYCO|nr:mycofactocin-coupled SDR family oxidoreductase [Mycobacterium montefiorense]GBG39595.1 short-chain dehydrogenase/reductase [Mycobacterium montefiorense]GKU34696.1 short-chain dehydrogenase/reductase [Mycobacterium montefiorense]GKU42438.1 short-chain dehydrogenase/reductase [Mycobacterium montefiorense]GKU45983.1 short-chain dehydrogenase/reductase [Mycobacterium montefiorense]GKU52066.1 short-chain dehydrogenase/reductase [Mycobacterium montefiorense]
MGMLDNKVAFITGAARGQGRSHAIRLAEEGADIIAIDLCGQIDCVPYQMGTVDDLECTTKAVESLGRRIVAKTADVRDVSALQKVVSEATRDLGEISIVVANAGIAAVGTKDPNPDTVFRDVIDVNLIGIWNTVMAAAPGMRAAGKGGSIVLISSTQGLKGTGGDGTAANAGYVAAKHGVVGLMRSFTHWLAKDNIRVNSVHPTGVETPMIANEAVSTYLANNPEVAQATVNLLPVPFVQPADISDAVLWLVSDRAKYVTGVTLPVDAGFCAR